MLDGLGSLFVFKVLQDPMQGYSDGEVEVPPAEDFGSLVVQDCRLIVLCFYSGGFLVQDGVLGGGE